MKTPLLTFLLLLFTLQTQSQTPTSSRLPVPVTVNVLSWNIYMLPRFARITGKRKRARAIVDQLKDSDYHILVFQEAFLKDSRRIIRKGLQKAFPHESGPANRGHWYRTNSGIWILSKLPLKELGSIAFADCAGFDDCLARKGALLVETEFEGVTFQVLGTHLQAGGPHWVRHNQLAEIRDLLAAHARAGIPQVICGDMNTAAQDTANYHNMLRTLAAEDALPEIEAEAGPDGYPNDIHKRGVRNFRIIDFIFYKGNGRKVEAIRRRMPQFRQRWNRKHQDLSDHFPVEAEIQF
ncbi:MAG: sphingomyelin phosphodiesterase [Bacteroidota bacterium]